MRHYFLLLALFFVQISLSGTESSGDASTASTEDEDEGFSKWDGIGLGVSIGALVVFCGALYLKEFVFCPHADRIHPTKFSERDHETLQKKIAVPNKEALEPVYLELIELLDNNANYTLDKQELEKIFSAEEAETVLSQYDLDKTGDISVWELRQYYNGDAAKAEEAVNKLKSQTKRKPEKSQVELDRIV